MPETEITVQYINQPKPGKKWGSIKSSEGEYYGAPPSMLRLFQINEVCKIEWKPFGDNGKAIDRKISTTPPSLAKAPPQYPRPRSNPVDQEQMFTVALLKEVYDREMTAIELLEEINKLRKVWRNSFGASEANRDDEMQDEIPY